MIKNTSFILLIILSLSTQVIYAAQSLVSPPYYGNVIVLPKASKSYKIDLSTLPPDADISLSVLPEDGSTTPEMYVGFKSQSVKNTKDADYSSTSPSGNIIFIPRQKLAGVQNIYVKLICRYSKCKGSLNFEFSKEVQMEANGKKHTETANHLEKAGSLIVRLRVPPVDDAERVVIHVDAIPDQIKRAGADLRVFINQGDNIPIENETQNIIGTSWLDGQTIVITADSPLFCTNCNYTLSLKFAPSSTVSIEAHVFASETKIGRKPVLDGADKEAFNTYTFKMKDEEKTRNLIFDVKLLAGKLSIFINCDARPESLNEYYWRYQIDTSEEIVLAQRVQSMCQNGIYYIMISGVEPSVYSIQATTKQLEKLPLFGTFLPIRGEISSYETNDYWFSTPANTSGRAVIRLKSMTQLNMSVTNCRFPTDCLDLFPNYLNQSVKIGNGTSKPSLNVSPFKYEISSENNIQTIMFDLDSEGSCYPIKINDDVIGQPRLVCAYKVSLYSENPFTVEYTLMTERYFHERLSNDGMLTVGLVPHQLKHFKLIFNETDITELIIKVFGNNQNAKVDLFVSKTDEYPQEKALGVLHSDTGVIILKNDTNLIGTYYIAIQASQIIEVTITNVAIRNGSDLEKSAQSLMPEIPVKGNLSFESITVQYYKISVDLDDNWEGSLNIKFANPSPNIRILVNNHEKVPNMNFRTWISDDRQVNIDSSDLRFVRKGVYYIAVCLAGGVEDDYSIVYSLVEKTVETENEIPEPERLLLGSFTSYNKTLSQDEIAYYEGFILPFDGKITVSLHNFEGHADIYLTLDGNNKYPNGTSYTYSTKGTNRDWIELNNDDLRKARGQQTEMTSSFYLAVIPREGQESASYSISLSRSEWQSARTHAAAHLELGVEAEFPVPLGTRKEHFYFYLPPSQSSFVTVKCPGRAIKLVAAVYSEEIAKNTNPEKTLPTNAAFSYRTDKNDGPNIGLVHLTIPTQNTSVPTMILLKLGIDMPFKGPKKPSLSNTYSILVNSQIMTIVPGKQMYGAVQESNYQYYTLNVTKPSCTLLISANILDDGDIALVVSLSSDGLPILGNAEFEIAETHQSKFIEISNTDIYPATKMSGTWVIGIFGKTSSLYTIAVIYEEEKIVELEQNLPFETYIKAQSTLYFRFYQKSLNNLEIKIDQISGDVIAYITTVSEEQELISHLPNKVSAKWVMKPANDFVLDITSDDPNACDNCEYLIALQASQLSKIFITISKDNQSLRLQNGVTYHSQLKAGSSRLYLFHSNNKEQAILSVNLEGELLKIYASQNYIVSSTVYLWELELSSQNSSQNLALEKIEKMHINNSFSGVEVDGKFFRPEENSFYLLFENPTSSEIKYSLAVTSKDSDSILKSGVKQLMTLEQNEESSVLYYSAKEDEIMTINIEFRVEIDFTQSDNQDLASDFKRKGLQLEAEFFREDSIESLSVGISSVPLSGKNIQVEVLYDEINFTKSYHVRQRYTIKSRIGKFRFSLVNPFSLQISPSIVIYSSQSGTLFLEQNSQASTTLDKGMSETYEAYATSPGSWYMWIYSCHGDIEFTIQDESDFLEDGESNSTLLKYGQQYSYNMLTEEDVTKYIKIQNSADSSGDADFVIRSSFFPDNKTYNYEPSGEQTQVQTELISLESNSSQLTVRFMSLQMKEYDSGDEILYNVRVCPFDKNQPNAPLNVCHQSSKCTIQTEKLGLADNKQLEMNFETLQEGQHYIHVVAEIQHQNKSIKFIQYQTEMIEVAIPSSSNGLSTLATVIIIIGILLLAGLIYYKCLRKPARSKLYSGEASETFLAY